MVPYGRQKITDADVQAVAEVFRSDFLTQGPAVPAFEGIRWRRACRGRQQRNFRPAHSLPRTRSQGSEIVWTSPITFVVSANCTLYCGVEVNFFDIDSGLFNISVSALEAKLERAALKKRGGQAEIEALKAKMSSARGCRQ